MLEDDFNDVLRKAIKSTPHVKLGVSSSDVNLLLDGKMNEANIRTIAPKLGLDSEKLIALGSYSPDASLPVNFSMFVSQFGHLGVNAYLLETENYIVIFDTGTDASLMAKHVARKSEKVCQIYITHNHPDHTAGIDLFPTAEISSPEILQGNSKSFDNYNITGYNVSGHASPATAYFIESNQLSAPLCVVGDAIFAGSVGGCYSSSSYQAALSNIKDNLLTLPSNTILCPGHGPLTTVQQEVESNPFF